MTLYPDVKVIVWGISEKGEKPNIGRKQTGRMQKSEEREIEMIFSVFGGSLISFVM